MISLGSEMWRVILGAVVLRGQRDGRGKKQLVYLAIVSYMGDATSDELASDTSD